MTDIIARGMAAQATSSAKEYIDDVISRLPKGIVYKGEVDYYNELPNEPEIGDCYTVKYKGEQGTETDGSEYVWGEYEGQLQWIFFGIDPSEFVKATDLVTLTQAQYDQLTTPVIGTYYFIIEE